MDMEQDVMSASNTVSKSVSSSSRLQSLSDGPVCRYCRTQKAKLMGLNRQVREWNEDVKVCVCNELYESLQIIMSMEMVSDGSKLMEKVCNAVNIPKPLQRRFWMDQGGLETCKAALAVKRSSLSQAMEMQVACKLLL